MNQTELQEVAHAVVRRAHRQGSVLASEIRRELARTGIPKTQWKKVVSLASASLRFRQGRYHYKAALSAQLQEQRRRQRDIDKAVREIIRLHKKNLARAERRLQDRIDFIQPVKVVLENLRELTLLSRDLSVTGIRLIGTESLLGQKVQVMVPHPEGGPPACFSVRILWTCSVGDGLFENGGSFLEIVEDGTGSAQTPGQ